jgi:hypothetical protein
MQGLSQQRAVAEKAIINPNTTHTIPVNFIFLLLVLALPFAAKPATSPCKHSSNKKNPDRKTFVSLSGFSIANLTFQCDLAYRGISTRS